MDNGKAVLAFVMMVLGVVGFFLTVEVASVLYRWNNLPSSTLQIIGSRFYLILPALLAIFCLMFELVAVYFFNESTK
ncbi:MAG: hypothetical protein OEY88_07600 [Candidatus Bathyarchaeota archaeon]|nr:hypothetical protein [Candidatus Bathyarchaeota archaeon]